MKKGIHGNKNHAGEAEGQELKGEEILVDNPGGFKGILQFFLHLEISNPFMQLG